MAAGSITTLPALADDGGGGTFPPGHFKDPKRLYCKNGGFFLRINPDGRVDGVREKSDPHSEPPPLGPTAQTCPCPAPGSPLVCGDGGGQRATPSGSGASVRPALRTWVQGTSGSAAPPVMRISALSPLQ